MKLVKELRGTGTGKLWISDFDGTLAINGQLLPKNARIIEEIIQNGAEFVGASARPEHDLEIKFESQLGKYLHDKIHFSGFNGNTASYKGDTIIDKILDPEIVRTVVGDNPEKKELVMFDRNYSYSFNPDTPLLHWYSNKVTHQPIIKVDSIPDNIYIVEFVLRKDSDFVALPNMSVNSYTFRPPFSELYEDSNWQQISSKGDKEDLIKAYAEVMGITDFKEIVCIGDGSNDKRMINNPSIRGIMMGNGNMNLENAYKTFPVKKGGFLFAYLTLQKNT